MRKFDIGFIVVVLLLFSFGCQSTTDPNIKEEIKYVSINSSDIFEYQTGIFGDEETAIITQQPKNHELSTIIRDSTTDWEAVYQYKAQNGFQGSDHVEIKLETGSDGTNPNKTMKLIKLEITVN